MLNRRLLIDNFTVGTVTHFWVLRNFSDETNTTVICSRTENDQSESRIQYTFFTEGFSFFYLQERIFLSVSNYIFTVIFVAEMTVKVNEIVRIKITNHGDDYGGEGTKPVIQTV